MILMLFDLYLERLMKWLTYKKKAKMNLILYNDSNDLGSLLSLDYVTTSLFENLLESKWVILKGRVIYSANSYL